MPDFEALVRQRLGSLRLPPDCEKEVVAELAAHLQDHYDLLIEQGSGGSLALAEALQSLSDPRRLRRAIVREKEDQMIARHKIMGPGMVALLLSGFTQWMVYISIARPSSVWWVGADVFTIEIPWILSLLAVGAVTGWLARRIGAKPVERALACTFPALVPAGLCLLALAVQLALDRDLVHFKPFLLVLTGWSLLPASAGLLGAVPFLRGERSNERKSPTATAATA